MTHDVAGDSGDEYLVDSRQQTAAPIPPLRLVVNTRPYSALYVTYGVLLLSHQLFTTMQYYGRGQVACRFVAL